MTHKCSITNEECNEPFPPFGDSDNYPCEYCSIKEMSIMTRDIEACMILLDIIEVEPKCTSCGDVVTKDNFGGIYNKPYRVSCNNLCCLMKFKKSKTIYIIGTE